MEVEGKKIAKPKTKGQTELCYIWNIYGLYVFILSRKIVLFVLHLNLHTLIWPRGGSTTSCKHNIYILPPNKVDMTNLANRCLFTHPADTEHH